MRLDDHFDDRITPLTVTIEPGTDRPEVHLHAGGQGFWVARLAATLGAEVVLCCALGGEPGRILKALIEAEPLALRAADAGTPNGGVRSRPSQRQAGRDRERGLKAAGPARIG
jgi:sugar/nucleoside kinase (ribokinase family)